METFDLRRPDPQLSYTTTLRIYR